MTSGGCCLMRGKYNVTAGVLGFLGLIFGMMILGASPAQAQDVDYSVGVGSVLNVTVPSSVTLNLSPTVKTFDSQNLPVTVRTNNRWGYRLVMSSTGTSLVNTTNSNIVLETLPELEGGYTTNTFIDNKWGYKIGNGNYMAYESGVTLLESSEPTAGDSATLNFAAKINHDQPAGSYNLALNFQVVAGVDPTPTMQDFTAAEVGAMSGGDTVTLKDSRDGQYYTAAKIGDLLWMTKNLDLAGGTQLTANDTHLDGGCGLTNCTLPASSTTGFSDDSTAYVYNSGRTACGDNNPCYSYYSWVAATAGTNPSSNDTTSDICPKGWRLPTSAELTTLKNTYTTGATLTAAPFLGVYGGTYYFSSLYAGGSNGYYWSSTVDSSSDAYRLAFDSSSANTLYDLKRRGHSVRCVKEQPTMQKITAAKISSMANGDTLTLVDARDGQEYTTAKINNQLWMTKNLNLAGGTQLTADDTHLDGGCGLTDCTLPASSNTSPAFSDNATAYVYNSGRTDCTTSPGCYSYYSYAAATAGTNPSSNDATSDICPKGWRLPTNAEYTSLKNTYSTGATLTAAPFLGVYGGGYGSSSFANGGSYGYYWSSTANGSSNAYFLYFFSKANTYSVVKRGGYSVRCVAAPAS